MDTGGFGWLLVIVNNPKIIGPKMSKIIEKKSFLMVKENNHDDGDVKLFQK